MSQSIEYTIESVNPAGSGDIENIKSNNLHTSWESKENCATITITFPDTTIKQISLYTDNLSSLNVIAWDTSGNPCSILEIPVKVQTAKKAHSFPINNSSIFSKCQININTDSSSIKLYYLILNTDRENTTTNKKPVQTSLLLKSPSFYPKSNGTPKKTIQARPSPVLKQSKLFGIKNTISSTPSIDKNPNKSLESYEDLDEQQRIYENIQNNRQKTLRSFSNKQMTQTTSYQNLLAPSEQNAYIVSCEEESDLKTCIAEICSVLGICYLKNVEEATTHLIYDGNDPNIIESAKKSNISIISKQWLLDCITQRKSLDPRDYEKIL